jgi:hypothetical protein
MKKSVIGYLTLLIMPFVSAYTGGLLYPGYFTIDTNSMVLLAIFLLTYLAAMKFMKKREMGFSKFLMSMIIALITTWWISKLNIDFGLFFNSYNLNGLIGILGPIIFIVALITAMWKWGISSVLLFFSGGLYLLSLLSLEANSQLNPTFLIIVGTIFLLIALAIRRRKRKKGSKEVDKEEKEAKQEIQKIDITIKNESQKPAEFKDRNRLARLLGIKNLENQLIQLDEQYKKYQDELEKGYEIAGKLFKETTQKSKGKWTGSQEGRNLYKKWRGQIHRNDEINKRILPDLKNQIDQIKNRISKLKDKTK